MSVYVRTIKKRSNFGRMVRVKWEVEDLISEVSQITGYQPFTVRNIAILYGLQQIAKGVKMPGNDEEFKQLLQKTSEEIEKLKQSSAI